MCTNPKEKRAEEDEKCPQKVLTINYWSDNSPDPDGQI